MTVKKEAVDYIRKYSKEYGADVIRDSLRKSGFSDEEISDAFKEAGKRFPVLTFFVLLIIIGGAGWGIYFFITEVASKASVCTTQECFIEMANNCQAASYQVDEQGTIYLHKTNANCIYEKKAIQTAANEPEEVRLLLEGKSFQCEYYRGAFNNLWLNTLTQGLQSCHGDLKEGVQELMISQYQQLVAELRTENAKLNEEFG